jgi:hypothetical protein
VILQPCDAAAFPAYAVPPLACRTDCDFLTSAYVFALQPDLPIEDYFALRRSSVSRSVVFNGVSCALTFPAALAFRAFRLFAAAAIQQTVAPAFDAIVFYAPAATRPFEPPGEAPIGDALAEVVSLELFIFPGLDAEALADTVRLEIRVDESVYVHIFPASAKVSALVGAAKRRKWTVGEDLAVPVQLAPDGTSIERLLDGEVELETLQNPIRILQLTPSEAALRPGDFFAIVKRKRGDFVFRFSPDEVFAETKTRMEYIYEGSEVAFSLAGQPVDDNCIVSDLLWDQSLHLEIIEDP